MSTAVKVAHRRPPAADVMARPVELPAGDARRLALVSSRKEPASRSVGGAGLVEPMGFEPTTSRVRF